MSTRRAPLAKSVRRRKQSASRESVRPVLDIEIHFGTYITQHAAMVGPVTPLTEWRYDDIVSAATQAATLLTTPCPLTFDSATWMGMDSVSTPQRDAGVLSLGVSSGGSYPFLTVKVRDFPRATFVECMGSRIQMAYVLSMNERVTEGSQRGNYGVAPAPGTLRNEFEFQGSGDFEERLRKRVELAAIEAARKAEGLPSLRGTAPRGKARTEKGA